MSTAGYVLGVDFGTSSTVVMLRWPDGRIKPLLFDGSPVLPSAVFAPPAGALSVGRDALHHGRHRPDSLEPNPKRRIDDGSVLLGEREVPVVEVIGAVLGRVAEEAARVAGRPPQALVLSHPAGWGPVRRLALSDSAAAAGLPAPGFVAEPVAAARYFTSVLGARLAPGEALVVYDLGAGTCDVSVIRTGEVLGSDGLDDVGGLDFDAAIVGWLQPRYDAGTWQRLGNPATVEDRRSRLELWAEARVAKEMLSRSPAVLIRPPLLAEEVPFTLAEFEGVARPLIDRTVRTAVGLTRACAVRAGHVLLVGGSSRIPLVATALHGAFGVAPNVTEQPETVVAEGCLAADVSAAVAAPAPARFPAPRRSDEADTEPLPVVSAGVPTGQPTAPRLTVPQPTVPLAPVRQSPQRVEPVRGPQPAPRPAPRPAAQAAAQAAQPSPAHPSHDRPHGQVIENAARQRSADPPPGPVRPPAASTRSAAAPPTPPTAPGPPRRSGGGRRLALTLLGVIALVAALAATALVTNVFSGRGNGPGNEAGPEGSQPPSNAAAPPGFPDWSVRYTDALDRQRGWSPTVYPSGNAECAFRNNRLEIDMAIGGIFRCPGHRDDLTDFALTIEVYLLDRLPCAGVWFRRGTHEDGMDSAYLVQVCSEAMVLSHHHAAGNIVDFKRFNHPPIKQGERTVVGLAVRGNEISVFRNDAFVGRAEDSAYPGGKIALGIAVRTEVGAGRVGFSNVQMRWP